MKRHVSLPPKSRRTARRGYTHRYTVSVHMIELRNRNFVRQLKNDIASGLIGDVELRGFGLEESMAMGVLLDTDPAKLASSSDIPVTISLLDRHEAFVTFGEYRFMKQERLMDWLDMVQTGTFRNAPDIEPSTEVLPRLRRTESADNVGEADGSAGSPQEFRYSYTTGRNFSDASLRPSDVSAATDSYTVHPDS